MGLIREQNITPDFVLSKVDEAQIFATYYPHFQIKKHFSSPFRRDSQPSCKFRINRTGKLVFTDFGLNESLDCFAFVGRLENLNYGQAIRRVACDFGLINCDKAAIKPARIKKAEIAAEHLKKETQIEFLPGKWDKLHLAMWDRLEITREELEREDVYPVDRLYINGKFISNWRNEVRYAYVIETGKSVYTKIYTPFTTEKQFKWISNIPLHIPFGINTLKLSTNRLIISKSKKEMILFRKFFPDVIALQAENSSALKDRTIKYIEKNYDRVYICMDADEAGFRSTEHFVSLGYHPVFIPSAAQDQGAKDWAEFVEAYGLEAMELYLKNLKLI